MLHRPSTWRQVPIKNTGRKLHQLGKDCTKQIATPSTRTSGNSQLMTEVRPGKLGVSVLNVVKLLTVTTKETRIIYKPHFDGVRPFLLF